MPISRRIIAAFIGVFLIGAVAGGLVEQTFRDARLSSFLSRTENPDRLESHITQRLSHDYNLSAAEQARINPLTKEVAQQVYQERRQFGANVLDLMDTYHKKVEASMDPDHRPAYEQDIRKRQQKLADLLLLDANPPHAAQ
jgi:hypothetical protein